MMAIVTAVLVVLALLLALPCTLFFVEVMLGRRAWKALPPTSAPSGPASSLDGVAVLIPAHNEAASLGATLDSLLAHCPPTQIWVIADNCTDDTADIARAKGVHVHERHHDTERGKGYALAFGQQVLAQNSPDMVIFLDADCQVEAQMLTHLSAAVRHTQTPVQARIVMHPHRNGIAGQVLSAFAYFTINTLRQLGLKSLGAPGRLNGTGMALPWFAVEKLDFAHDHLAEDLEMGLTSP